MRVAYVLRMNGSFGWNNWQTAGHVTPVSVRMLDPFGRLHKSSMEIKTLPDTTMLLNLREKQPKTFVEVQVGTIGT